MESQFADLIQGVMQSCCDAVGNEFPDDSEFKDLFREAENLFIQAEVRECLQTRLVF
jgi:hypothetical protein